MAKRNEVVDWLRGVLILIVVWGHALQVVHGGVGHPIHEVIRFFQMPAFFVLAGFSYAYVSSRNIKQLLVKHGERLLLPYLSWLVLGVAFSRCEIGFADRFLHSNFWFLRVMFFAYIAADVARWICQKKLACVWGGRDIVCGFDWICFPDCYRPA